MTDTGGAAFPREAYINPHGVTIRTGSDGMTLRDWFAGQALAGLMANCADNGECSWRPTDAAVMAYRCADAMIAASTEETPHDQ